MKRIMSVMIGLSLALGTAGLSQAQEKGTDQKTAKKDPAGKKDKKKTKQAPKEKK